MSEIKNATNFTPVEISQFILEKYVQTVKFRFECDCIIEYLAEHYCISNELDWLDYEIENCKKWRLEKAMKELKFHGYVMGCAVDCAHPNNQKDSWKLTNRGTRLAKILFKDIEIIGLSSARKAQVCCRNRNVARMMFERNLRLGPEFYESDYLSKHLNTDRNSPYRGSIVAGYLFTTEGNYLVYNISQTNIPIFEKRELAAMK